MTLFDFRARRRSGAGLIPAMVVTLLCVGACGPELDAPSPTNMTGHWVSADDVGGFSNLAFDVSQKPDGTLTGSWSANFAFAQTACPPGLGPTPSGSVTGSNTTLLVMFALDGVGDFQGQLRDDSTIQGSVLSCDTDYLITFTRVPPTP